jgi:hypothetical protein
VRINWSSSFFICSFFFLSHSFLFFFLLLFSETERPERERERERPWERAKEEKSGGRDSWRAENREAEPVNGGSTVGWSEAQSLGEWYWVSAMGQRRDSGRSLWRFPASRLRWNRGHDFRRPESVFRRAEARFRWGISGSFWVNLQGDFLRSCYELLT